MNEGGYYLLNIIWYLWTKDSIQHNMWLGAVLVYDFKGGNQLVNTVAATIYYVGCGLVVVDRVILIQKTQSAHIAFTFCTKSYTILSFYIHLLWSCINISSDLWAILVRFCTWFNWLLYLMATLFNSIEKSCYMHAKYCLEISQNWYKHLFTIQLVIF